MKLEYINKENKYKTTKAVLRKYFGVSERLYLKLIRNNKILVNNSNIIPYELKTNDVITTDISFDEQSENIIPIKMNLDIIFEDDEILIVNKPANMPVHPSAMHFEDSLSNGIRYYFMENNIKTLIRPVNRLDKDTSGIVIFAKNQYIQEKLNYSIIKKAYKAILIRKS